MSKDVFKKCFLPALECGVAINKKNSINALPAQIDLPVMEAGILDYWTKNQVFEKSIEIRNFDENLYIIIESYTSCMEIIVSRKITTMETVTALKLLKIFAEISDKEKSLYS